MEQQQRVSSHDVQNRATTEIMPASGRLWFDYIRRLTILIFHENWLIYTLPLLAIAQFFQIFGTTDLRVVFTILAGSLYFPIQVLEIHRLVITKRIQRGYSELFSPDHIPDLPNDHFFK